MANYDLRKVQMIELEILQELDRVCKENEITYFLDSGTALGAIRHGGFIPWDDDIDVGMMREDYERFLSIAPEKLNTKYFLQTLNTDPKCPCLFAKIRKNGTIYQENNKSGMKMHMGIWIDIFPFDYISSNPEEQKRIISKARRYRNLFMLKKIPHIIKANERATLVFYLKAIIRKVLHCISLIIPDEYYLKNINRIIESQKKNREYVTCLFYGNPVVWKTNHIIPAGKIVFEGKEFMSVKDIDYYLKVQYGDYMKLPPIEERAGHKPIYIDCGVD